jgi:hypothetical protein
MAPHCNIRSEREEQGADPHGLLPLVLCRWYAGLHVAHDVDAGAHDDEHAVELLSVTYAGAIRNVRRASRYSSENLETLRLTCCKAS